MTAALPEMAGLLALAVLVAALAAFQRAWHAYRRWRSGRVVVR